MNIKTELQAKQVLKIIQSGVTNKSMIIAYADLNRAELQHLLVDKPYLQHAINSEKQAQAHRKVIAITDRQRQQGGLNLAHIALETGLQRKVIAAALRV